METHSFKSVSSSAASRKKTNTFGTISCILSSHVHDSIYASTKETSRMFEFIKLSFHFYPFREHLPLVAADFKYYPMLCYCNVLETHMKHFKHTTQHEIRAFLCIAMHTELKSMVIFTLTKSYFVGT